MTVLGINRADLMQERYRIVQPPKERVVLPEVERTAEEPRMPVRKPEPEREQRPADRLDIAAKRFIIEDERKLAAGRAAAAVFQKYNGPKQDVVRDRDAGDATSSNEQQPAAWAPARQNLGRVEALLQAVQHPHMHKPEAPRPPETPPAPEEKPRPMTRLQRIEREAREAGRELRDLLPRRDERTDGRDDPGRTRGGPGGR